MSRDGTNSLGLSTGVLQRFRSPRYGGAPEGAGWERVECVSADGASRLDLWFCVGSGELRFQAFGGPELIAAADWCVERTLAGELVWPQGPGARALLDALELPATAAGDMALVEYAFRALPAAFFDELRSVRKRSP
jgi:hypothetical protein